jgi:DNA-binding transcriptional LysR family regulator
MTIDLRQLRVFVAVAEELSYRRAAARLHVAQAALSRTIMGLEAAMQVILIERTTRVVRLTDAGRKLLEAARLINQSVEDAVEATRRVHRGELGDLVVGYNDFVINSTLPAIVRHFRSHSPDVSVRLASMPSPEMAQALTDGRIDIAFLTGSRFATGFEAIQVRQERLVCVLPGDHPMARNEVISVADLNGLAFVEGHHELWASFLGPVHEFCARLGCHPRVVQTAQYSDGIIGLVEAGMGVAFYVDSEWLRYRRGIVVRPVLEQPPLLESLAVWSSNRRSPALESFLRSVREVLARHPGPHRDPLRAATPGPPPGARS